MGKEPPSTPKRGNRIVTIACAGVVAIVILSVLFVYYSPDYSLSSSIRDHDGDGTADRYDPLPRDSSVWAYGRGQLAVTINNDYPYLIACYWYVNGELEYSTAIEIGTLHRYVADVIWLMGPESTSVNLVVMANASMWASQHHFGGTYLVTNDQVTPVNLAASDFE